ncbi:hypothetical protein [Paenibacillus radicis (ex Gao et al. 2016)]|uniref:Uncharacterized protein n=1 Tax=Paenibacillus radicis (ex Gao et al. 2016) TaxID=1737354 RepID=A0A917HK79_9BACL|nr:hypothetical protein [Paenibacillus radicis (ex Gao et al. 2016)]GGG82070.1 hypothetical protein GCM10010918_44260 [Paenibacillus radicis (ex Gao et al. 2016)]
MKHIDHKQTSEDYVDLYGEEYTSKILELERTINTRINRPLHFNVFGFEAGLGKSRETNRIIDESFDDWNNTNKFLIVKPFKKDVIDTEEYFKHWNMGMKPNVLGITSENSQKWEENCERLRDIRVIIITHQRYKDLCLKDELRDAYSKDRNVLIIDEKINFPIFTFSKTVYDEVRSILGISIQGDLDKVCDKLLRELQKNSIEKHQTRCIRCELKINPRTLENFMKLMEVNMKSISNMLHRKTVENFIEGLALWYSNKCIYNGGNISTCNQKHSLWGLENNIILDAGAIVDGIYRVDNKRFTLLGQERIVDHSKSFFHIVDFNSSKEKIKHNKDEYFAEISARIKSNHKIDDKTLIICHKENANSIRLELLQSGVTSIGVGDDYFNQEYAINWFNNLVGKNLYSDFTKCWIIGTPNLSYEKYPIQYMQYAENGIGKRSLNIVKGRFVNPELNLVQVGFIAAEIYQSIKRIQRNSNPKGEFFLVNSDPEIISSVFSQIKGMVQRKAIKLDFTRNGFTTKEPDNVDKFIEYITAKEKGTYEKKQILSDIKVSNFSRIAKDERVIDLIQTSNIRIHNKHVEVL